VAAGRFTDVRSGRQTFERYVTITWLPRHVIEANARQTYTHMVERYLLSEFGGMRMNEILPRHVRDFVRRLGDDGTSAHTIQRCRTVLGAIFTTALCDDIVFQHPCAGVKGPVVPPQPLHVLEPEELDAVLEALPGVRWRLLVEVAIETGVRWGELTELRVDDLDVTSRLLTGCRAGLGGGARGAAATGTRTRRRVSCSTWTFLGDRVALVDGGAAGGWSCDREGLCQCRTDYRVVLRDTPSDRPQLIAAACLA
jgi:integrase